MLIRRLHLVGVVGLARLGALTWVHHLLVLWIELEHLISLRMERLATWSANHLVIIGRVLEEAIHQIQVVVWLLWILVVAHLVMNWVTSSLLHKHRVLLRCPHLIVLELVGLGELVSAIAHVLPSWPLYHLHHIGNTTVLRVLRSPKRTLLVHRLYFKDVVLGHLGFKEPSRFAEPHISLLDGPMRIKVLLEVVCAGYLHNIV